MAFSELVNFRVVCVQVQNIPGTIQPTHASSFRTGNKRLDSCYSRGLPTGSSKIVSPKQSGFS